MTRVNGVGIFLASCSLLAANAAGAEILIDKLKDGTQGPAMVSLPAGRFIMGSPESERGHDRSESPMHLVWTKPIAMSQFEITFAEYDHFAAATRRKLPDDNGWGRGTRPVINVSWADADAYARWLSKETRHRYRLPSESEWEFAARAGRDRPFSTGECISGKEANFIDAVVSSYAACPASGIAIGRTQPVGSYSASGYGLNDMHGNVWEWLEDCAHPNYENAPSDGTPRLGDCRLRSLRGGSWADSAVEMRSALRNSASPLRTDVYTGFRLVREF